MRDPVVAVDDVLGVEVEQEARREARSYALRLTARDEAGNSITTELDFTAQPRIVIVPIVPSLLGQ